MPGTILSTRINLGNRDKVCYYRQSEYKKFLEIKEKLIERNAMFVDQNTQFCKDFNSFQSDL